MEKRYKLFAQYNVRDLKGFNEKVKHGETGPEIQKKLPQIVIIIGLTRTEIPRTVMN